MAKNMAVLENGVVSNIIWCSDALSEGERLKDPGAYPVTIGDTYDQGQWYRSGELLLTPREQAQLEALEESYAQGVNSL